MGFPSGSLALAVRATYSFVKVGIVSRDTDILLLLLACLCFRVYIYLVCYVYVGVVYRFDMLGKCAMGNNARALSHYSGRMSERRGSTSGCSWHRYVMAHIRYIIDRARITVLLQTLWY